MTRDQERARELISVIEGTNLTADESDGYLTLTIVADRDAEIAHLRAEVKYLEGRLAKEKERTITEALGQAA